MLLALWDATIGIFLLHLHARSMALHAAQAQSQQTTRWLLC